MVDKKKELGKYKCHKKSNYINNKYQSFFENSLSEIDPDIHKAITDELNRQQSHIELIASENIVSQAVLKRKVQS